MAPLEPLVGMGDMASTGDEPLQPVDEALLPVEEETSQPDQAPELVQPRSDGKVETTVLDPRPTPAPMPTPSTESKPSDSQGWKAKSTTRSILGSRQG
jgi:hypothetical protein